MYRKLQLELLAICLQSQVRTRQHVKAMQRWRVYQTWRRSCPLSEAVVRTTLMLTSNEHIVMFRTTTNGDLCDFLKSSSLTTHRKMAANNNNNNFIAIYSAISIFAI